MSRRMMGLMLVLVSTIVPVLWLTAPVEAEPTGATFTVNSPSDVPDANPGNGICETGAGNGTCTLRAAVQEANALAGADVINIGSISVLLTRVGEDDSALNGDLDISGTLTIAGAGLGVSIINQNGAVTHDRVFHVLAGATVEIRDVGIWYGNVISASVDTGGGIYIANGAHLTLKSSLVIQNYAHHGGGIFNGGTLTMTFGSVQLNDATGHGGGIYNEGVLIINGTILNHNTAELHGAGLCMFSGQASITNSSLNDNQATMDGGGLFILATGTAVTLTHTIIRDNSAAANGGGISIFYGQLTMSDMLIERNQAYLGGGLYNENGTVRATQTLFKENRAGGYGGGIYHDNFDGAGIIQLTNSTIGANRANRYGGGLYSGKAHTNLFNVTIASNIADDDNNDASDGGGIKALRADSWNVSIQNSVVANNVHRVNVFPGTSGDDCSGTLIGGGHNLVEDISGCTIVGVTSGNKIGIDAMLDVLADYGGFTPTYALKATSPAIDAGNPSGCTDPLGTILTIDQRGFRRPANGAGTTRCDMGAYEAQRVVHLPLILR